ncbi:MAG TPA: tetratricopeptide repeat protein, partial [Pyrinomonadaceae bacterium]|nr:tetratricopeptide repeat protein [Pyrinomonadaceae bacterium]
MKYRSILTILLATLLASNVVFTQKPRHQTPPPQNERAKSLIDAGEKLADDRKWNEALEAYKAAIGIDPQNADAYIGLGDAYMATGRSREALDAYKRAVLIDPRSADAQYALGDAYNTLRMHGDAFAPLVKAIQLDPTFAEAHYGIGYAYLSGEQYEKSLNFLKRAVALKPDYDDAHYSLAIAYLHLENQKGLDDERKKLQTLSSALTKKLADEIHKFNPAFDQASSTLVASKEIPTPSTTKPTKPVTSSTPAPEKSRATNESNFEIALWNSIKNSKDPEDFNYYLRKYPNGKYAELARVRLKGVSAVPTQPNPTSAKAQPAQAPPQKSPLIKRATGPRPEPEVMTGHAGRVSALAFSPDERVLASGDYEGAVKLWNAQTGRGLRTLEEKESLTLASPVVEALTFSTDGKLLAAALALLPDEDAGIKETKTEIRIWDVVSGRLMRTLSGINIDVKAIAFSPNNRSLVSGGVSDVVTLWDVTTGRVTRTFSGRARVISSVMFLPDGTKVMSGSWDTAIDLWSIDDSTPATQVQTFPQLASSPLVGPTLDLVGPILNPYAKRLVSVPWAVPHTILIIDSSAGQPIRQLRWEDWTICSVALSMSGKVLASGNNNGDIQMWDIDSGAESFAIRRGLSSELVAISPDNGMFAQVGEEGKSIRLWDTSNETTYSVLTGHGEDITWLTFSPNSSILASSSDDQTIRLWDVKTGDVKVLTGHTDSAGPLTFSPDGTVLASIADNLGNEGEGDVKDNTIKFWNVESGKQIGSLPDPAIPESLSFSPDGSTLVVGHHNGTIALLDATGKTEPRILNAGRGEVGSIAFVSPAMFQSMSLSADETTLVFQLWDLTTGRLLKTTSARATDTDNNEQIFLGNLPFMAMSQQFMAMPVKGNGISLFSRKSVSDVIDPTTQQEIATLYILDNNNWLVTTPDGLFDGSPGAWSAVSWRFNNNTFDTNPVESFFNEFYYPGLLGDILAGKHPQASADITAKDRHQPHLRVSRTDSAAAVSASRDLKVQIDITDAAAGAQDVRLFRNGALVKVWRGDVLNGKSSVSLAVSIPIVAGENKLTAYAFNRDNVKSVDASLSVAGAESLRRKGIAYVVAIGIDEYANPAFNLKYAVADAQDFAAEVKAQQINLNNYDHVETVLLSDHQATKENMMKALSDLASKAQPEDAVIIYFAGHGEALKNRFYLIPYDLGFEGQPKELDKASLDKILSHGISDEELGRAVEALDPGQLLLVIDACHSGQALESEDQRRGPMNSKGLFQLAYDKGMYILAAAQSYQEAQEDNSLGHGLLTYALVDEGLKNHQADKGPRDGSILVREWLNYATSRVPQLRQQQLDAQQKQARTLDRVKSANGDSESDRKAQRPKVFYRRELELHPLIVATTGESAATIRKENELAEWKRIESSMNRRDFEQFLADFADGIHAAAAKAKLNALKEAVPPTSNPTAGSFAPGSAAVPNVTLDAIQSKYNRGLIDEVINDARVFLQQQPDNAKVNMMLGFALLSRQRESEGLAYLDKGFLAGEPVTYNVRRHRFLGPLLQDGSFDIGLDGLIMRYGDEVYSASFNRVSNFEARNYGQSGIGLFIKGRFLNRGGKEENKDFNLFAPTATVRQILQGLTMVPIVSCFNCDGWTNSTVNLFNHLRSVSQTQSPNRPSGNLESTQPDSSNSTMQEQAFNVS